MLSCQQFGSPLGKICDGEIRVGAADACKRFENGAVAVEPAIFECG
jgi:hypothetical protein